MQILKKAFGEYATNCYILKGEQGDLVIDPGQGSFDWVMQNTERSLRFEYAWAFRSCLRRREAAKGGR